MLQSRRGRKRFICASCNHKFMRLDRSEPCSLCGGRLKEAPDSFSKRLDKQAERIWEGLK